MKGKDQTIIKAAPSADLLVCFPSRANLGMRPKPSSSPAETGNFRRTQGPLPPHLKRMGTRGAGQSSPLLWGQTKRMEPEIAEPTSPKVTCAGQIKPRPTSTRACKSWQSVMEEIERIHKKGKREKKRPTHWFESLGLKKEVTQFLSCLRNIRFDLRCFRNIPAFDDSEDEEEGCRDHNEINEENTESSSTMFSKWFTVLQENQNYDFSREDRRHTGRLSEDGRNSEPVAPPPNALLLMRCRSAPVKRSPPKEDKDIAVREESMNKLKWLMDEEKRKEVEEDEKKKEERVVVMRSNESERVHQLGKFYADDAARETWIVAGMRDPLSRSRSWKR